MSLAAACDEGLCLRGEVVSRSWPASLIMKTELPPCRVMSGEMPRFRGGVYEDVFILGCRAA